MGPAWIVLATPGSAARHISAVRHVTDCATQPGEIWLNNSCESNEFQLIFDFLKWAPNLNILTAPNILGHFKDSNLLLPFFSCGYGGTWECYFQFGFREFKFAGVRLCKYKTIMIYPLMLTKLLLCHMGSAKLLPLH